MTTMSKTVSYLLFILWLCYLIVSSIHLFTRGFLLTRTVQKNNSTCVSHTDLPCSLSSALISEQCSLSEKLSGVILEYNTASSVCLPPRARVILLIVDALRYDFALYDEKNKHPLPFQNKLPVIHRLLNEHPQLTRLYKFIADPPTTTMQRLKALTTGSLPTFIDAGSNFATSEINEDNFIDQLTRNNRHVVFMGDDTLDYLYPNRFVRKYPYPSFNVWDLDTVDNGIKSKLYPEMNNTDWSLLIGHFLGVDHCGHRYGPNHPEMERKLGEMNEVIENVIQQMDDDMMLFVIGDHGMTVTGEHGGESELETSSALFVYSHQTLLSGVEEADTVKQVDLVPTLSTILGVPIPFQNLGALVLNCLPERSFGLESWKVGLYSLWANAQQIIEYIKEYSSKETSFNPEVLNGFYQKYSVLSGRLITVRNQETFLRFAREASRFLMSLREMCEEVWVQYEPFSMARGLVLLFLSVFFVFLITDGIPIDRLPEIFMSSFLSCSCISLFIAAGISGVLYYFEFVDNLLSSIYFTTGLISQLMLVMLIIQNWELISLNWLSRSQKERIPNLISRLVMVFNLCGLFSNSYIVEESFVLLFLLVSVIIVSIAGMAHNLKLDPRKKNGVLKLLKLSKLRFLLMALTVAALVRISMYFWRCREEQLWCFASPHEANNITMKMETTKVQWAITVVCLAVLVFTTKEWLRNCGNLNGYSLTVTQVKFLPTTVVVCIAAYWAVRKMPHKQTNNSLALAVYALTTIGVVTCVFKPICAYIIPVKKTKDVPSLMNKSEDDIPVICGLGTVYSSVYVIIGVYLTLLFALLLGDAIAPTALIMFFTLSFILIVTSIIRIDKANSIRDLFDVPNISVLIWIILSQYFFYATGHQPAFPNITWEAAFIGTSGVFSNNLLPGTLIIFNTFCSYILMGVMLPLVLIAPFTVFVMIPSIIAKKLELQSGITRGEVVLFEQDKLMITSMFTLACKYIMGHAIRVFASMLAATIHCRHLMVWKIFAPKLIFESIGMFVTIVAVVVGFLLLVRINKQVEKLVVKLNKMS